MSTFIHSLSLLIKTYLGFSFACYWCFFTYFINECFSVFISVFLFEFLLNLFGIYLYLIIKRLPYSMKPLRLWLVCCHSYFIILFICKVFICFNWNWAWFYFLEILLVLASMLNYELFSLLCKYFMECFSRNSCQSWATTLSL